MLKLCGPLRCHVLYDVILLVTYTTEPASTLKFEKMVHKVTEIKKLQKIGKIKTCIEF